MSAVPPVAAGVPAARSRLFGLDALRGILALAVVAHHTSFLTQNDPVPSGFFAVDVFFMMSGFVIAHAYEAKLLGGGYIREFVWRRYSRLAPMWIIGLTIGTVSTALFGHRDMTIVLTAIAGYFLGIFFIPAFFGRWLFFSNPPGWSLFFEVCANVAYGLVARFLKGRLLTFAVILGGVLVVAASWTKGGVDGGPTWDTAYIGVARTLFGFSVGVYIFEKRATLTGRALPGILFTVCVAVFCGAMLVKPSAEYAYIFDPCVIIIFCPLIVICALNCVVRPKWLAETLGSLSYPLYAIHFSIFASAVGVRYSILKIYEPWSLFVVLPLVVIVVVIAYFLGAVVDPAVQRRLALLAHRAPVRVPSPDLIA